VLLVEIVERWASVAEVGREVLMVLIIAVLLVIKAVLVGYMAVAAPDRRYISTAQETLPPVRWAELGSYGDRD
jgi:hypothetical protein